MRSDAERANILTNIVPSSTLLSVGNTVMRLVEERQKPESERQSMYLEKNIPNLRQQIINSLRSLHIPIDKIFLQDILEQGARLSSDNAIDAITTLQKNGSIESFIDRSLTSIRLTDTTFLFAAMEMTPQQLKDQNDPLIGFLYSLHPEIEFQNMISRKRTGDLNRLMGKLIDVKQQWKKTDFIPDANSTLRMTFGTIRGYSPADAVYYSPISTLKGVIEKTNDDPDYNTPWKIRDLYAKKDFGRYKNKKLNDVPVAILYDMDTTGGNSGSPVLNAKGELVGVNFDRAFEATINDYAWNQSYSRSIAVDIRYVLWNVEKVAEADFLLKEIGIR
jgi:hypothetical protein